MNAQAGGTRLRAASGLILAALVLTVLWVPMLYWAVDVFVALIVLQGLREYCAITAALKLDSMPRTTMFAGVLVVAINAFLSAWWWESTGTIPVVSGLSAAFMLLAAMRLFTRRQNLAGFAADFMGVAYVAGLSSYVLLMHRCEDMGPGLVTFLLVAVGFSDTGAYFVGRKFGRHKMAPVISPKKSWEGAVGGVLFAALSVLILLIIVKQFGWVRYFPTAIPLVWALLAAFLSIVSQVGDLVESMFKREAGIKDASNVIPGHGGVLDRCDGLLFAAPALYYIYAGAMGLMRVPWLADLIRIMEHFLNVRS